MLKQVILIFCCFIIVFFAGCQNNEEDTQEPYQPITGEKTLVYFYGDTWPWCTGVDHLIARWEKVYKNIKIVKINKFAYRSTGEMLQDKELADEWKVILEYYNDDINKIYEKEGLKRPVSNILSSGEDVYVPFVLHYDEKGNLIAGTGQQFYVDLSKLTSQVSILVSPDSSEEEIKEAKEKMISSLNPEIDSYLKFNKK